MSFRQHNKDKHIAWLRHNRLKLIATGVPTFVVDDEFRWNYVLHHGDDLESGWSPAEFSKSQAAHLLELLRSQYTPSVGLCLFDVLEKKLKPDLPESSDHR